MKTINDNYYFTQIYPEKYNDNYNSLHFITFANTPKEARQKINFYLQKNRMTDNYKKFDVYHNNYKKEARQLIVEKKIIE